MKGISAVVNFNSLVVSLTACREKLVSKVVLGSRRCVYADEDVSAQSSESASVLQFEGSSLMRQGAHKRAVEGAVQNG